MKAFWLGVFFAASSFAANVNPETGSPCCSAWAYNKNGSCYATGPFPCSIEGKYCGKLPCTLASALVSGQTGVAGVIQVLNVGNGNKYFTEVIKK